MPINQIGLPCPNCDSRTTRVVNTTRSTEGQLVRRRHCEFCDHRFYTLQNCETFLPAQQLQWLPVARSSRTRPVKVLQAAETGR